jgi:hypothetical protein
VEWRDISWRRGHAFPTMRMVTRGSHCALWNVDIQVIWCIVDVQLSTCMSTIDAIGWNDMNINYDHDAMERWTVSMHLNNFQRTR